MYLMVTLHQILLVTVGALLWVAGFLLPMDARADWGEKAGKISDISREIVADASAEVNLKVTRSQAQPANFLLSFCDVKTKECLPAIPEPGISEKTYDLIEHQLGLQGTAFAIANNGTMLYALVRVKARLGDLDEISRQRLLMQNSLICDMHYAAIASAKKAEVLGLKEASKDLIGVLGILGGLNGPDPEKPRTFARKLKEAKVKLGEEVSLGGVKGLPTYLQLSHWLARLRQ